MVDDLQYIQDKIESLYNEILAYYEIEFYGYSLIINDESAIKEMLLRSAAIGYNRYKKNFSAKQKAKKPGIQVIQFDNTGTKLKEYASIKEAERAVGVSHGTISGALKRKGKGAGFYWIKKVDYEKV